MGEPQKMSPESFQISPIIVLFTALSQVYIDGIYEAESAWTAFLYLYLIQ